MASGGKNRSNEDRPYASGLRASVAAVCVPGALVILFYSLCGNRQVMEKLHYGASVPVRRFLGGVWSMFPFSVAEVFWVVLIVWAVIFVLRTLYLLLAKQHKLRRLVCRLCALASVALFIWAGFCWLWSTGYYVDGVAEKSGLPAKGATLSELVWTARIFAAGANETCASVPRDENGDVIPDVSSAIDGYDDVYSGLLKQFPFLEGKTYRPKPFYLSRILSRVGFTGFYFPLTGETNINTDSPACFTPVTVAHEMAHQRGVSEEAEADLVAIAA